MESFKYNLKEEVMSKVNSERGGCVDVFHASLLKGTHYAGEYDFPVIKEEHDVPRRMIPPSGALNPGLPYFSFPLHGEE